MTDKFEEIDSEISKAIDDMVARWPSNVVARKSITEFTGGAINPRTISNEDAKGTGPEGRFLLMNQTVYPVKPLSDWLKIRSAKTWQSRKSNRQVSA